MQPRPVLAVLLLATVLPAAPAAHARVTRPLPCNQVRDDDGDGTIKPIGLSSPALDIISADISTGAKEITATLRLKSTSIENDPNLTGGANWNFNVTSGGINYSFYARWTSVVSIAPREVYGGLTVGNSNSTPAATFKRVGNAFLWTVSRQVMSSLKKPKQVIMIGGATSGADSLSGDSANPATPGLKYVDRTLTCLPSK